MKTRLFAMRKQLIHKIFSLKPASIINRLFCSIYILTIILTLSLSSCSTNLDEDDGIKAVAAGGYHTVALKNDGTLWSWGYNNCGQLGLSGGSNRNSPVQIGSGTDWSVVAAGYYYTVAIKNNGTLWSWGHNNYGQLGNGTVTDHLTPVQIGSDTDWSVVAAGGDHTVALENNGTLWAWGCNSNGRLGDGTIAHRDSPVKIGSDTDWSAVFAGGGHTIALKADGSLWAWGRNDYGQLGLGDSGSPATDRNSPVQIPGGNWASVSGGNYHTIASKRDGTLWAWGRNDYGQLGLGNKIDQNTPERLGQAADLVSVSGGNEHSTALRRSGILWTWGLNSAGQLGDGTNTNRDKPGLVKWK